MSRSRSLEGGRHMSLLLLGGVGATVLALVAYAGVRHRNQRDRARALAGAFVADLMQFTWVWLGGERGVGFNAYQDRLRRVAVDDALAPETQAVFRDLGRRAADELARVGALPSHLETLRVGLQALRSLANEPTLDAMIVSGHLDAALEALLPLLSGTGGDIDLYEKERHRTLDSDVERQRGRLGSVWGATGPSWGTDPPPVPPPAPSFPAR